MLPTDPSFVLRTPTLRVNCTGQAGVNEVAARCNAQRDALRATV
jgi:hypothetical protein